MGYEFNRTDVWEFARSISAEVAQKGDELFFQRCPYCNGGESDDRNTFSVNLVTGTYNCFRATCGKQGHFVELARDFGFRLDFGERRQYRKLKQSDVVVRGKAVEYLAGRGISREIVERYRITTRRDNEDILVFPFYDEQGTLTFIKYRNTKYQRGQKGSKEWCERDTKPILFGMDQCVDFGRLVITEGQIDSLSLAEAGITNAVSVPTGAKGFTWLTNVWDWITQFQEVVVFGDFEQGRMTLVDELAKRLPNRVLAVLEADFLGEKDANDILTMYGKSPLKTAVEHARAIPMKNVKELADVEAVDLKSLPKVKTNIREIDRIIGGLYFGQVILLTGKRGEGKSTFMSQLVVEAIDQDFPVFVYSGELTDYHFKNWIDLQAAGQQNIRIEYNEYGDEIYWVPKEIIQQINTWYRGKAYIYDNNYVGEEELESLLETIEKAVKQYGIKMVCIDNLMTALDVDLNDDVYRAQSKFVKSLKLLAVKYSVAVVLVAHPRKTNPKDKFSNDDIAGSGDIANRVDYILMYERNKNPESDCDGKIHVTKNRLDGKLTGDFPVELFYSKQTKRITSKLSQNRKYSWENKQWYETIDQESIEEIPFL